MFNIENFVNTNADALTTYSNFLASELAKTIRQDIDTICPQKLVRFIIENSSINRDVAWEVFNYYYKQLNTTLTDLFETDKEKFKKHYFAISNYEVVELYENKNGKDFSKFLDEGKIFNKITETTSVLSFLYEPWKYVQIASEKVDNFGGLRFLARMLNHQALEEGSAHVFDNALCLDVLRRLKAKGDVTYSEFKIYTESFEDAVGYFDSLSIKTRAENLLWVLQDSSFVALVLSNSDYVCRNSNGNDSSLESIASAFHVIITGIYVYPVRIHELLMLINRHADFNSFTKILFNNIHTYRSNVIDVALASCAVNIGTYRTDEIHRYSKELIKEFIMKRHIGSYSWNSEHRSKLNFVLATAGSASVLLDTLKELVPFYVASVNLWDTSKENVLYSILESLDFAIVFYEFNLEMTKEILKPLGTSIEFSGSFHRRLRQTEKYSNGEELLKATRSVVNSPGTVLYTNALTKGMSVEEITEFLTFVIKNDTMYRDLRRFARQLIDTKEYTVTEKQTIIKNAFEGSTSDHSIERDRQAFLMELITYSIATPSISDLDRKEIIKVIYEVVFAPGKFFHEDCKAILINTLISTKSDKYLD